jgi:hypothetical protein
VFVISAYRRVQVQVNFKKLFVMKKFTIIIYCFMLVFVTAYSLKKPAYNWDALPYMGIVLSYDNIDPNTVHSQVYSIAKDQMPTVFYNRLVDPANPYRNNAAQSTAFFQSQLPFYVVKPLYTGAAWLFYKAGVSLVMSTVWPSAIAYFLTGLLLFLWLKKYWDHLYACIASLLIMLSPPMLTVAGLSTPDAFSGFLLFTAVYFITEYKSVFAVFVFLLLAVFARLDNIIPAVCFLSVIFFTNKWERKISAAKKIILFSVLLLACFIVSSNTRVFGWSVFFYPAFAKQLNSSYTVSSAFNFEGYIELAKTQLTTGLFFSFVSVFFFLVVFLLWNASLFSVSNLTMEQALAMLFVLIILLRFILQPLIADRIYIAYYLSVIAFLVKKNSLAVVRQ